MRLQHWSAIIAVILTLSVFCFPKDTTLTPEEIIARHLESIGPKQARDAANSRELTGKAHMDPLVGGVGGELTGDALVLSEGNKVKIGMKFGDPSYPQEQLVYDGNRVVIGTLQPGKRSALGQFLVVQQEILKEGLMGGALSTAWPLLDVQNRKPKLTYNGLKKIGARQLHELKYVPRKGDGRLEIRMYFEPETFRHVRTTYEVLMPPEMNGGIFDSQLRTEKRFLLEEQFSDFRPVNGLMLPASYGIQFSADMELKTGIWSFQITLNDFNGIPFPAAAATSPAQ